MLNVYNLIPKDSHNSFYGKAKVLENNGLKVLRSYDTDVAYYDADGKFHKLWDGWSATTGRHIKAFGGPASKKEWEALSAEKFDYDKLY